ncbi:hypothetical_protein [Leishmania braziliensis MHOM/BR/75/M2904]|uniref:Hypothetical_protein n=1 Tax=Leishmania braziliensis MHOM/BR/75/M2904 TaxID=420245 RepID=A0A3P3ZK71_LEIBR|nr:hypothetical_protein [Leishmania braziliensis MHOM/BR/75/M2904]
MVFHRLDLVDQGVESLEGLAERKDENFLVINLQRNRLTSFEFFGTHKYVTEVHFQHNRIQSFRGLTKQVSLKSLHLQGCPVSCHPYYRLMALLTIGFGLEDVDGLPITSHERHVANGLGKRAALAVSYGWLLDLHPRTDAEYDVIINEFRRLRKDEYRRTQNADLLSVKDVLANLDRTQRQCGYNATAELQLAERQQIITRLARRVAQLERLLAVSPPAHVVPLLPPSDDAVGELGNKTVSSSSDLFSAAELALMDSMRFVQGIQLRHNLGTEQSGFQRVCLQVDHTALTAESYLSRVRLVQLPLRSLRVRYARPLTLVAEDQMGGTIELRFDSLPLLQAVYKAVFFFSAYLVPPLSVITQSELQRGESLCHSYPEALTPSVAPMNAFATLEAGPSASCHTTSERSVHSAEADALTPTASGSRMVRDAPATKRLATLDNVADVPPLPATHPRLSTTRRSHSSFSLESTQQSRSTVAVTKDCPTPVALSVESHKSVDASVIHASGAVPKSPKSKVTKVHLVPLKSKGFSSLSPNYMDSDSIAFYSDAQSHDYATVENVAVAGERSSTSPSFCLASLATSDAASPAGRTETPPPPCVPPRKKQAERIHVTPSVTSVKGRGEARAALLPRSDAIPSFQATSTPGDSLQSPFIVSRGRWTEEQSNSINFQTDVTDGDGVKANTVDSAAKNSIRSGVSSRFGGLLIESSSDSEERELMRSTLRTHKMKTTQ